MINWNLTSINLIPANAEKFTPFLKINVYEGLTAMRMNMTVTALMMEASRTSETLVHFYQEIIITEKSIYCEELFIPTAVIFNKSA